MRTASIVVPTLVISGLFVLSWPTLFAHAQGSGSSRLGQPGYRQPAPTNTTPAPAYRQPYPTNTPTQPAVPRPPTTEEYASTLWRYLVRPETPYTRWPPLPGKEGSRKGEAPHGAFVRAYANGPALADPKALPSGSVIVLEDYAEDQKTRTGINIIYRVKGYDPRNGDWYWMKYLPNGVLARTPPGEGNAPIAGRAMGCIECHRKAGGGDFVFSNDTAEPAVEKKGAETKTEKTEETKGEPK